jgi:TolB-like protein
MSAEVRKEIQLEIAHVLFIDIVGYSKLSINEQHAAIDELNRVVRTSEQFQKAEASDRLIKIPTGDGMALVFYTSPEAPVQCAIEISRQLKEHTRLQLRMGVHSGPVRGVIDVTGRANLAGAGLNMANRVMSCGDAGHILVSKRIAEDLSEYEHWRPFLHDLGACEVKHGVRIGVVSLYDNGVGNPQLPKKFQALKRRRTHLRWAEAAIALLVLIAVVAAFVLLSRRPVRSTLAAPEKSIAVLPFENLSRDPDNAYFATGIQDEILTRLAKIAALKVIAHTSTEQYASRPGNLSEIARQLGVTNILEGSVQKAADQVHINAQLILAATGEHLWAESYDRKVENIFGVEAEVATAVAEALKAKLTGAEQNALEQKTTNNPEAYDAYLRGLAYSLRPGYSADGNLNAIKYLDQAVKIDPQFALAWAWLAHESALGYFNQIGGDVAGLRESAKRAADKAIELQPELAEALMSQGYLHYYCEGDYDIAIVSFEKAGRLAPSNSEVPQALALVYRRKGQWPRSVDYVQRAIALDPRNPAVLSDGVDIFWALGQYETASKLCDEILSISPGEVDTILAWKASMLQDQGNLSGAGAILTTLNPDRTLSVFYARLDQWVYEGRYDEALVAAQAFLQSPDASPRPVDKIHIRAQIAWFQHLLNNNSASVAAWKQLETELEALYRDSPQDRGILWNLAWTSAALGDKARALSLVKRLTEVYPLSKDAIIGMWAQDRMAIIATQTGEKELALKQLETSARSPNGVTYGNLKFNPIWDPLRGDPRFEKIVASLAPKESLPK